MIHSRLDKLMLYTDLLGSQYWSLAEISSPLSPIVSSYGTALKPELQMSHRRSTL